MSMIWFLSGNLEQNSSWIISFNMAIIICLIMVVIVIVIDIDESIIVVVIISLSDHPQI